MDQFISRGLSVLQNLCSKEKFHSCIQYLIDARLTIILIIFTDNY